MKRMENPFYNFKGDKLNFRFGTNLIIWQMKWWDVNKIVWGSILINYDRLSNCMRVFKKILPSILFIRESLVNKNRCICIELLTRYVNFGVGC